MTILIDIAKKLRPKNAVKGDVLPQNHILNYVLRKIRLPVRILRFRENPYLQHFVIPFSPVATLPAQSGETTLNFS